MRTVLVLAALLATACATPYQKKGIRGGYDDTQLGENVFRVTFESNTAVSAATTSDYVLLRSAEVALEHGFAFFVVTSGESSVTVSGNKNWVGTAPSSMNTIACFRDRPEGQAALVYDAKAVRNTLRAKYGIDAPKASPAAASRRDTTKPIDPYATQN
jgi:hypothetical protein